MLNDYVLPHQSFVACPNQDVTYGLGYFSLDVEPAVIQVPDFGDRFWVYALYDARTDQFGEVGRAYGTEPGFYLLIGPNWDGEVPDWITAVIQSPTELAMAGPRVFMDDTEEDRAVVQTLVSQIDAYPLEEFDGIVKLKDWDDVPSFPVPEVEGETAWVEPEKFFDQLPDVMDVVSPSPGEEALYASVRQVLCAAEEDPELMKVLVDAAVETEEQVIGPIFAWTYNGKPASNGWNRSINNAEWGFDCYWCVATLVMPGRCRRRPPRGLPTCSSTCWTTSGSASSRRSVDWSTRRICSESPTTASCTRTSTRRAVLADPQLHHHRPQPSLQRDGLDQRVVDRLPGL